MAIATAIAVGGLAITAATTANSFIQAGQQKKKQREAEASASKAMAAARGKLEQNFALEESINKDPYELEREAMISLGGQQIQAGAESERGGATTAGQVMMNQNLAQAGITGRQSAEMSGIKQRQIAESSRLRDLNVQLDLGQVEGAQNAARDYQEASAASSQQGIQGATSLAQQGLNMLPLYFKDGNSQVESVSPEGGISQGGIASSKSIGTANYNTFSMPMSNTNYSTPFTPIPTTQQLKPNYYNFSSVGGR